MSQAQLCNKDIFNLTATTSGSVLKNGLAVPTHFPQADPEVWLGRRKEPMGVYAQSSGQSRPLAAFDTP